LCGVIFVILPLAVLIQYWSVTDRYTERWTGRQSHNDGIYRASIASHGNNHATSFMCAVRLKFHLVDLFTTYNTNKFPTDSQQIELMDHEPNRIASLASNV